jgi:hypothetical protein
MAHCSGNRSGQDRTSSIGRPAAWAAANHDRPWTRSPAARMSAASGSSGSSVMAITGHPGVL